MKLRTKIEACIVCLLLSVISGLNAIGTVTISDTGIVDDTLGTVISFDNDWIDFANGTFSSNISIEGNIVNNTNISNWDAASDAIYAQLSDLTDQTFAATGTGYNITFNTNDEINGITHSTVSEPQNITIVTSGVYSIIAQPQVHADAGASGYFHMWIRKDTGSGFADVANTNVELILASNDEAVIPLIAIITLNAGDVIRINASVSHTGIELDAQTPTGEPTIPSIIFSMYRIGS